LARPKYVPTEQQLKRATRLKNSGHTVAEICEKLKITITQHKLNRKLFNDHFTQFAKTDLNKNIALSNRGSSNTRLVPIKQTKRNKKTNIRAGMHNRKDARKKHYNEIGLAQLESYVICGYDKETIARLLGISRKTLYTYAQEYPPLQDILDNSRKRASEKVINSLLKSSHDRQVDDTAVASYLGEITTKSVKKFVPASVTAQKYWLTNAERWSHNPEPDKSNNRGSILGTLDNLMSSDKDEEE